MKKQTLRLVLSLNFRTVFCTFLKRERNQTCAKWKLAKSMGKEPLGLPRTSKSFLIQNAICAEEETTPSNQNKVQSPELNAIPSGINHLLGGRNMKIQTRS